MKTKTVSLRTYKKKMSTKKAEPVTGKKFCAGQVKKAHAMLLKYGGERKVYDYTIKDVLTDIRHYCDAKGLDVYELLDSSYQHYLEKRKGKS